MIKCTYVDHMGDDNRVVDAARVSFAKESSEYSDDQNHKLLNYLANHNHWSPFSHVMITVHEEVPIFVARQRFKSTVGFTYNEVSRRYVDDSPRFYVPDVWRKRAENKKQGSSDEAVEKIHWKSGDSEGYGKVSSFVDSVLLQCKRLYQDMIEAGIAPEQARMVLPQSMITEYICTGSLAAFARAYKLRADAGSQKEIQELAAMWLPIMQKVAPVATSCLVGTI